MRACIGTAFEEICRKLENDSLFSVFRSPRSLKFNLLSVPSVFLSSIPSRFRPRSFPKCVPSFLQLLFLLLPPFTFYRSFKDTTLYQMLSFSISLRFRVNFNSTSNLGSQGLPWVLHKFFFLVYPQFFSDLSQVIWLTPRILGL